MFLTEAKTVMVILQSGQCVVHVRVISPDSEQCGEERH